MAVEAVHPPGLGSGEERVEVGLDIRCHPNLVLRNELVDRAVGADGAHVLDRLGGRVACDVVDLGEHVPMDASLAVERVAAAGPDHQPHELAGVRLVLRVLGAGAQLGQCQPLGAVAADAGVVG